MTIYEIINSNLLLIITGLFIGCIAFNHYILLPWLTGKRNSREVKS